MLSNTDIIENKSLIMNYFSDNGFVFFSSQFDKVIHHNKKLGMYIYVNGKHIYLYCIDENKKMIHRFIGNVECIKFTKEYLDCEIKNFIRVRKITTLNIEEKPFN